MSRNQDFRVIRIGAFGLKLLRNKEGFYFIYYSDDLIVPLPVVITGDLLVTWSSDLSEEIFNLVVKHSKEFSENIQLEI